jgi:ribose transport system ATP-binding protein
MGRNKVVTDRKRMKAEANRILSSLEMAEVNPDQKVRSLGMGQKQLVEISKALVRQSRIFILDEPTSSLTSSETDRLFKIVAQLKKEGVAIIFISHKLDEIAAICDRVTVLRDGERIVTKELSEVRIEDIVRWMVGRTLSSYFPPRNAVVGDEALRLERIGNRRLKEVTLSLHYGEVVGLAGLVGSGRTELARAIFGLDRIAKGRILLNGKSASIASTTDAVRKGIAFITEDRKSEGLVFSMNVEFNTNLAALGFAADGAFIRRTRLRRQAEGVVAKLNVKPADIHMLCRNLSGGNQQKVVIGKWLVCNAKIFVFDEPTRGIDVGSKVEVHRLINTLAESGAAILMISSEIEEVIGMSDRVYVMHDGSITAALEKAELTQERLMFAATAQKAADEQPHGVPGAGGEA